MRVHLEVAATFKTKIVLLVPFNMKRNPMIEIFIFRPTQHKAVRTLQYRFRSKSLPEQDHEGILADLEVVVPHFTLRVTRQKSAITLYGLRAFCSKVSDYSSVFRPPFRSKAAGRTLFVTMLWILALREELQS
jgi:hypothetical protein